MKHLSTLRALPARLYFPGLASILWVGSYWVVFYAIRLTGGPTGKLYELLAWQPNSGCFNKDHTLWLQTLDRTCAHAPGVHWVQGVDAGAWWQVLTTYFVHFQYPHIIGNSAETLIACIFLESILGARKLLVLLLATCGIFTTATMLVGAEAWGGFGASGFTYGVIGALSVFALRSPRLWMPVIFFGYYAMSIELTGDYSYNATHIAGYFGGALIAFVYLFTAKLERPTSPGCALNFVRFESSPHKCEGRCYWFWIDLAFFVYTVRYLSDFPSHLYLVFLVAFRLMGLLGAVQLLIDSRWPTRAFLILNGGVLPPRIVRRKSPKLLTVSHTQEVVAAA